MKKNTIRAITLFKPKNSELIALKKEIFEKTSFLNDVYENVSIAMRIFCFENNITFAPKCKRCNEKHCMPNKNPNYGFSQFCSVFCAKHCNIHANEMLGNKEWLYGERIGKRRSIEDISSELNISGFTVTRWLRKHNIPAIRLQESESSIKAKLIDTDWLFQEHKIKKRKVRDIAKEVGCCAATLAVALKNNNITANSPNSYQREFQKTSKPQKEIYDYVHSLNASALMNQKIDNFDMDIFIPEKNFGIEYHGLYHHRFRDDQTKISLRKDYRYHKEKSKIARKNNIFLFQIWSSQWDQKKEIVKSMIATKLGVYEKRIFGRKCHVTEISTSLKNMFLEENHLQGKDKSKLKYGLFYGNELVAVMSFGKSRYDKNVDWELIRYAVKRNHTVIGGFSKLLMHFERNYKGSIVSYADLMYSNGDVYEKNGFKMSSERKANYWYIDAKKCDTLLHRSNFTKKRLGIIGSEKTEWEEMKERKFHKIYDAGILVFHKNRSG